jgi:transposase-like protein
MRKLLRKQGFAPTRVTTDKLRSYSAAFRHLGISCHHDVRREARRNAWGGRWRTALLVDDAETGRSVKTSRTMRPLSREAI